MRERKRECASRERKEKVKGTARSCAKRNSIHAVKVNAARAIIDRDFGHATASLPVSSGETREEKVQCAMCELQCVLGKKIVMLSSKSNRVGRRRVLKEEN